MDLETAAALLFQALCTLALAGVHFGLWRQRRQRYHATWAVAWAVYALRLGLIAGYIVRRELPWLFAHQVVTLGSGLLLLWAALQFATHAKWRPAYVALPVLAVVWAWIGVFVMRDMAAAGMSSALLLSVVTFGTGVVFVRHDRRLPSVGARLLAWGFIAWGLHHLDYPLLRSQGSGVMLGVFMDVTLILLVAVGTLTLVLGEERAAVALRNTQLEQLSDLLLRAQEEERRRIARELHDRVGQNLSALNINLDILLGKLQDPPARRRLEDSLKLVDATLQSIENVMADLRPALLDEYGLAAALAWYGQEYAQRTGIRVGVEAGEAGTGLRPEAAVALFRIAQEALNNAAKHSSAKRITVGLEEKGGELVLSVSDDGKGFDPAAAPRGRWGMTTMRERAEAAGGRLSVDSSLGQGTTVRAAVPL
jgi:signal transduction histidine kinase